MDTESHEPDALEYFEDSLASIFDDIVVSHGSPGNTLTYSSLTGPILLRLTQTSSWEEQLKFSHFLWDAELRLAGRIDSGSLDVKGKRVLELGAGAGLCGILAVLRGAQDVVLSDYPAESMLINLQHNLNLNIPNAEMCKPGNVVGHAWGEDVSALINAGGGGLFDIILVADCLWMPEQHKALCKTIVSCLKRESTARVYCIAGFHSGRQKLSPFFAHAAAVGLTPIDKIYEVNHRQDVRSWEVLRPEEDSVERKKWLVVADLGWSTL